MTLKIRKHRLPLPKTDTIDRDLLDAEISEEEVLFAISSLQNNKARGPDGFPIGYLLNIAIFIKGCNNNIAT